MPLVNPFIREGHGLNGFLVNLNRPFILKKLMNRQHHGPNENCSDTHHLKYGNRQHPSGPKENCSDTHHLK
jgi:hypothetical protein